MTDHTSLQPVPVSWREYMQVFVQKETSVIMARLDAMDKAMALQTSELARRLDELNHARTRELADRADFVRREIYDQAQREAASFREQTTAQLAAMRGRDVIIGSIAALLASGIVLVGARLLIGG